MAHLIVKPGRVPSRLRGEFSFDKELDLDKVNLSIKGLFERVSYDRGLRMVSGFKRDYRAVIYHDGTVIIEEMRSKEELEALANQIEKTILDA